MAKRLINLIIPLIGLGLTNCNSGLKEPSKKDYDITCYKVSGIFERNLVYLQDLDNDKKIDVITNNKNKVIYYCPKYEGKIKVKKFSRKITPEMREAASNLGKNIEDLRYEAKKINIEYTKKRKNK